MLLGLRPNHLFSKAMWPQCCTVQVFRAWRASWWLMSWRAPPWPRYLTWPRSCRCRPEDCPAPAYCMTLPGAWSAARVATAWRSTRARARLTCTCPARPPPAACRRSGPGALPRCSRRLTGQWTQVSHACCAAQPGRCDAACRHAPVFFESWAGMGADHACLGMPCHAQACASDKRRRTCPCHPCSGSRRRARRRAS